MYHSMIREQVGHD